MKSKRGLSAVIVTLILILLVLAAVAIIWVVIKNILEQGSESIFLGKFTLDLEIEQVKVEDNEVHITIKRNPGQGNLKGIKFFVSDGENTYAFEQDTNIGELGKQTFIIDYDKIIIDVSIAPIVNANSGQTSLGNIIHEFKVDEKETVKSFPGLVSWWRFQKNANDEMSINNGTIDGATLTGGKFGSAYKFHENMDKIIIADHESLRISGSITIAAWVKAQEDTSPFYTKMVLIKSEPNSYPYALSVNDSEYILFLYNDDSYTIEEEDQIGSITQLEKNKWYHITGTFNSTHLAIYVNGQPENTKAKTSLPDPITGNLCIGNIGTGNFPFNGTIDEVMIFNESLTAEQIQLLYNLDLS